MDIYENIWNGMCNFFGERLAHPDTEPKRFAWQCKLYKYINNIGQKPPQ
jgi:hypothetical protein